MKTHRIGSRSILIDLPDLATVMDWHAGLVRDPLPGQVQAVAAARTVMLTMDSPTAVSVASDKLRAFSPAATSLNDSREIAIDVVYDGEDLDELAGELGLSVESLITWHTTTTWVGAFGGFAPGFTYCVAEDDALAKSVPRRSSPRTAVPAGAVGLAGEFSAVYPRQSPGGWQLIGTTATPMWDAAAEPPARVAPGYRVSYRQVRERIDITAPADSGTATKTSGREALRLDDSGLLSLVEDLGRAGYGDLGVTTSGAADRASATAANEVVGNSPRAAVLENIGGLHATAVSDTVIAVTGAEAGVRAGRRRVDLAAPALLLAGESLEITPTGIGLRHYLAIRGGIAAPKVLGSASSDELSGLGPQPVEAGETVRRVSDERGTVGAAATNPLRVAATNGVANGELRIVPGPRDDWFLHGIDALSSQSWTVSGQSNRVGLRLEGASLERSHHEELPSEGIVAGSIQVPAAGEPVVFFRDHAVTGGYPVIATVVYEDLDIAAQLPPGAALRFIPVDPDTLIPLKGSDS